VDGDVMLVLGLLAAIPIAIYAYRAQFARCPYCVERVHARATRCPHCTSQLVPAPPSGPDAEIAARRAADAARAKGEAAPPPVPAPSRRPEAEIDVSDYLRGPK